MRAPSKLLACPRNHPTGPTIRGKTEEQQNTTRVTHQQHQKRSSQNTETRLHQPSEQIDINFLTWKNPCCNEHF
ncbi:Uncharacterized protein TCM_025990 [Theobroma cacao]|uniref:Uncharacterized protein n=1 Tax=Theobroma cacao TaxID=3641 RepID=A0A061F1D4_THECC|nr:Uncharacterized protein TCM_025990 [Theobroma cacao]